MFKFLIDESSGRKLFLFLLDKGFDVKFVGDIIPRASDLDVLELAEKEKRILITNDKDFGELIFRLGRPSSGVILLRLKRDFSYKRQSYVSYIIDNLSGKIINNFIVVTEGKIRIRKYK